MMILIDVYTHNIAREKLFCSSRNAGFRPRLSFTDADRFLSHSISINKRKRSSSIFFLLYVQYRCMHVVTL